MNTAILVLLLVAAAFALPQDTVRPAFIPVVSRTEVRDLLGQFTLDVVSGDGTRFSESGRLVPNDDGTDNVLVKTGKVSYTSPEGIPIVLEYDADKLGFRARGAHLPVAPTV